MKLNQAELDAQGFTVLEHALTGAQCDSLIALYTQPDLFRSRVVMARHNFGRGEYQYFDYPLPPLVEQLRSSLYPELAPIANRWSDVSFPATHADYLKRCHEAGQTRPTPLLLRYEPGDYNCLHRDLYGENVFPLQVAFLLSSPGEDFTGGEFVLTSLRPRMQSRVEVVPLRKGDAVVFAVNQRPVQGTRGMYRVAMRHGVSRIRSGLRYTMGIIFHDAAANPEQETSAKPGSLTDDALTLSLTG